MNVQKLAEELDELRSKTQLELERLRVQERQVHEIEANTLRDQREQAVIERDRARNAERDALDKFDELNQRYAIGVIITGYELYDCTRTPVRFYTVL